MKTSARGASRHPDHRPGAVAGRARVLAQVLTLVAWALWTGAAHGAQTLYKSVDPDGKVTYSDRPPAEGRLDKTMTFENLPSSTLPAATSAYMEELRKTAAKSPPVAPTGVVLYAASWCGYCKKAKAYLAAKGIKYQEFDIDTRDGMAALAQAGGGRGVPVLFVGGRRIKGFTPAAYDAVFASLR